MGLKVSCFDNNHLSTVHDSTIERPCTDDELTVFIANSSFLFEDLGQISKEDKILHKPSFKILEFVSYETDSTPKLSSTTCNSPSPAKNKEKTLPNGQNRIFSSNVTKGSVNIIEKIQNKKEIF